MARLFIGIEFSGEILAQLREIQDSLRRCTSKGRFVPRENMHLTLQFLGEVKETQVSGIIEALGHVAGATVPFHLTLGQPGVFGQYNPYRVVWLGVAGETILLRQMQQAITKSLANLGFSGETGLFRPHITLARDVVFCGEGGWQNWSSASSLTSGIAVGKFALIESVFRQGKRIYRPVQHFSLCGAEKRGKTNAFME